jgi:hypothetical protein
MAHGRGKIKENKCGSNQRERMDGINQETKQENRERKNGR